VKVSTPRTIRQTRAVEELTLDDIVEPFGTVTRIRERIVEFVKRDVVMTRLLFVTVVVEVTAGPGAVVEGGVVVFGGVVVEGGVVVGGVVTAVVLFVTVTVTVWSDVANPSFARTVTL
jgi:hypothetical protein